MTHEDAGHYSAKHPHGSAPDPLIADAVNSHSRLGEKGRLIPCAAAHQVAADLSIEPVEIGVAIDLMEIRIEKCQLGLFGYTPQKKRVTPADHVARNLARAIDDAMENNTLSCRACWEIADRFKIKRQAVSAACEKLQIKIAPCQLGAF